MLPTDRVRGHQTFIFFPLVDWHARIQRSQQLACALADLGHLCIYVNPHLGLEFETPPLFSRASRLSVLRPGVFELHVHLPAEHPIDARLMVAAEIDRILCSVRTVVQSLGIHRAYQMVSTPSWLNVASRLREQFGFPVVYDCHDHLAGFERLAKEIVASESLLLKQCDQVVFSAQYLLDLNTEKMPELQDKASLLRNACKPQDFDLPADRISKPLSGRPKVGYAGSLDHWIDFELLKNVTAMLPEMDFVFAGRIEDERIQQLRGPNVNLLGEIPYVAVPKMLHECDAAIIPFARVPLTMATNPIKLYEYFCAGLPVVSTRLPEIEEFSDLVYVSDTAEEFASALRRAVAEQDRSFRTLRLATGRLESWERRAAALLERLSACGLSDELTDPVEDVGLEGSSPFSEGEKLRGILNVRT